MHARTGHFNQHFSTAFKQIAGFALEVLLEKYQGSLGIIIYMSIAARIRFSRISNLRQEPCEAYSPAKQFSARNAS